MGKPNNPPAFPFAVEQRGDQINNETGMTLRDYFAGQALQGIANGNLRWDALAAVAYQMADAMLVEREKN